MKLSLELWKQYQLLRALRHEYPARLSGPAWDALMEAQRLIAVAAEAQERQEAADAAWEATHG